jgi:hypothetical protein
VRLSLFITQALFTSHTLHYGLTLAGKNRNTEERLDLEDEEDEEEDEDDDDEGEEEEELDVDGDGDQFDHTGSLKGFNEHLDTRRMLYEKNRRKSVDSESSDITRQLALHVSSSKPGGQGGGVGQGAVRKGSGASLKSSAASASVRSAALDRDRDKDRAATAPAPQVLLRLQLDLRYQRHLCYFDMPLPSLQSLAISIQHPEAMRSAVLHTA